LALDDPLADVLRPVGGLLGGDPLLALAVLGRDAVLIRGDRGRRGDVQRQVAGELDELLVAGDEVGLAVDLHQHADLVAGVDVALDRPLAGLLTGALGGLGLSARAQDLDRLLQFAAGLGQSIATGQHAGPCPVPERFDLLCVARGHALSSVEPPDASAGEGADSDGGAGSAAAAASATGAGAAGTGLSGGVGLSAGVAAASVGAGLWAGLAAASVGAGLWAGLAAASVGAGL